MLTSADSKNLGSILENLIYLELRRQGHRVFVGHEGELEIDFVTEKEGQRIYIQVALSILDEGTAVREFKPLLQIDYNYPKYVMSLDTLDVSRSGIRHISAERFLMGQICPIPMPYTYALYLCPIPVPDNYALYWKRSRA